MASKTPPADGVVRCIRLSIQDLAIAQLQNEPSALRGFQRFVATILKTTSGCAHPNREACLGVPGFPAFPSLTAHEADLLIHLPVLNYPQGGPPDFMLPRSGFAAACAAKEHLQAAESHGPICERA